MCHDNSFLLHATQNGIQLYVLTFYDGFWPLLFIENSRHYIYLVNVKRQFCHSKCKQTFFRDTTILTLLASVF